MATLYGISKKGESICMREKQEKPATHLKISVSRLVGLYYMMRRWSGNKQAQNIALISVMISLFYFSAINIISIPLRLLSTVVP